MCEAKPFESFSHHTPILLFGEEKDNMRDIEKLTPGMEKNRYGCMIDRHQKRELQEAQRFALSLAIDSPSDSESETDGTPYWPKECKNDYETDKYMMKDQKGGHHYKQDRSKTVDDSARTNETGRGDTPIQTTLLPHIEKRPVPNLSLLFTSAGEKDCPSGKVAERSSSTLSWKVPSKTDDAGTNDENPKVKNEKTHQETADKSNDIKPNRRRNLIIVLSTLLVAVSVATIILRIRIATNNDNLTASDLPSSLDSLMSTSEPAVMIAELPPDTIIAYAPEVICMEQVPGGGWSNLCSSEDTMMHGSGACNLVAQAFLDQVPAADIAIQNSGSCLSDVAAGDFTVNDAMALLPRSASLFLVYMSGSEIILALEQALEGIWGERALNGGYPYSAGLRFKVNATAEFMHRVSHVEVKRRLALPSWSPISLDEGYFVVANSYIVSGANGYDAFGLLPYNRVENTGLDATETFMKYAIKVAVLVKPQTEDYSTQEFVPNA